MKVKYNNELENKYSAETDIKYRRSLGQFFTPYKIASFMADWILDNKRDSLTILDPATGLGIFERALKNRNTDRNIKFDLFEIDKKVSLELKKITSNLGIKANILNSDFLTGSWDKKYDGIIANPPYYKHHFIKNKEDIFQKICSKTYFKFSIQTNIYCWFLIKSMNLLSEGGRLAFIVPSEFLNANYGEKIKEYLLSSGIVLHLININFEENVFDNALTTSSIILAEKHQDKSTAINFFSVSDVNQLDSLNKFLNDYPRKKINNRDLSSKVKWRNYFNGYKQKDDKNFILFSQIGKFSRGIATGSNEYFTLTPEEIKQHQISIECLYPCITKANFVKDILFSDNDFELLVKQNKKTYLFDGEKSNHKTCINYIKKGENENIHNKFLTKNRTPWFALEKRGVSKIWVSVFGRSGLKFIWNTSDCKNLTCFHSFYPTENGKKYLDILFVYLNTDFAKNLFDREKREYGNGLEKFEPNDINKSLILNFEIISKKDIDNLKRLQKEILKNDREKRTKIIEEANSIFKSYLQSA
ncbi:MAG: N-6 DNA methylase [bacterium]|nr:N-6 DNA methylase [bacterium]